MLNFSLNLDFSHLNLFSKKPAPKKRGKSLIALLLEYKNSNYNGECFCKRWSTRWRVWLVWYLYSCAWTLLLNLCRFDICFALAGKERRSGLLPHLHWLRTEAFSWRTFPNLKLFHSQIANLIYFRSTFWQMKVLFSKKLTFYLNCKFFLDFFKRIMSVLLGGWWTFVAPVLVIMLIDCYSYCLTLNFQHSNAFFATTISFLTFELCACRR